MAAMPFRNVVAKVTRMSGSDELHQGGQRSSTVWKKRALAS